MNKLIAWGVLLAGLIASNPAQAADLTWTNGNGTFANAANWNTGTAPVAGDNTLFTNDTSYTVSFNANSPYLVSSIFTGRAGVVTLDIGTFTWSLTNFSLAVSSSTATVYLASGTLAVTNAAANAQVRIGDGSTSAGTLIVTNGTVIADGLNLGTSADASGKLVISGAGVVTNSALGGTFSVGSSGSGCQLIITNGGRMFVFGDTRIGNTSASNNLALISGSNSIWSNSNLGLRVGAGGRGNMLIVSNGAKLFTENGGTFGGNGSGTAFNTGIVVGAGSALISPPAAGKNMIIGTNAGGSTNNNLTIYDGGFLTCGGSLNVGNAAGAISNSFNMGGSGAVSTGSVAGMVRFDVNSEFNRVTVTNAVFDSASVSLGGKTNTVSVLAGTQWTMSGNLTTAGSLTTVGAKFTINGGIVSNGAAGVLIGQGPVSGSQLIITNGGKLYSNFGTIGASGASGASMCTAIVAGVGSVWSNTGASLLVGNGAGGSGNYLAVLDGATLFNAGTLGLGNNLANANSVQVGGIGAFSIVINSGSNNIGSSAGSFGNRLTVTNASLNCDVINVGVSGATNNLLELKSGSISVNFIRVRPTNSVLFTAGTLSVGGTTVDALANNGGATVVGDGTSAASLELAAGGTGFHDFNAGGLVITNNATLRGNGTLMGSVTVLGTWSPGFSVGSVITSNNLIFGSSAVVAYDVGTSSDSTAVNGNLTLNGTLNVSAAAGFGVGTYTLFTYTGTLSGNGLTIATTPDSGLNYAIDTNTAGQVKLDVTIPPPPTASFSGNPTSGAVPLVVTFTNASSGSITNSFWDFGDGNTTNTTAVSFNHTYSSAAVYTVSLTAYGQGGSDTNTQLNYITALTPPHLVVDPGSLTYGSITIGRTSSLSFSVINTGDLPLSGTAASAPPFSVTGGGTYNNLASGHTQTVTIAFTPASAVSSTGSVIFVSDGGNSTNTVIGTGLTPGSISVTPASHDFGNLATDTTAQVTFVVTNSGGTVVSNGTAAAIGGPFTVVSNATFSVPGFGSTNVVVQFAPVSAGAFTNSVAFASDNGGVATNTVIGTGAIVPIASFTGTPTSGVAPLAVTFTNTSSGSITNAFWDFGDGHTTNTMAVTLDHTYSFAGTSTVSLTVFGPVGSNTQSLSDYIVATNPPPPVAAFSGSPTNGTVPLTVTFTNASSGSITNSLWSFGDGNTSNTMASTLVHTYNSAGTNTVSLTVSGLGGGNASTQSDYIVVLNPAHLVVNPGSLSFGSLTIGLSNSLSFSVVNTGDLPLSGTASSAAPFSVTVGDTYNNLASGQTQTVTVAFQPGSAGAFTGSVIFVSDGGNSTNTVTGTGLTPGSISVTPASLSFGTLATGATAQLSFVVTNSGGTSVSNGTAVVLGGPFTIVSGASFSLPGLGATNVTVRFAPVSASAFTDLVAFATDNGGAATNTVIGAGSIAPVASFTGTPTNGVVQLAVTFTDSSSGSITNRFWDFGDGVTSNTVVAGVSHTYSTTGTNTVSLTVFGPLGTNTQTRAGYIVALNAAHLVVNPGSLNYGSVTIGPTNNLNFSVVNTGDLPLSGTATSAAPFSVTVGASYNVAGGQTQIVTVAFAPSSAVASTGSVIFASDGGNSTNTVTGTGLTPGSITVTPASQDFGTQATGTTAQLSFVVTNSGGTAVSNGTAIVGGPFTVVSGATFSVPGLGTSNITVRFAPVSAGAFTNSVAFGSANGGVATNTVIGTGAIVPVASFSANTTTGGVPLAVTFTDSSSGTITNRFWDFGDGNTTNTLTTSVAHTYNAVGTNTVILTVSGPLGTDTQTRNNYIVSYNPPIANFSGSPTLGGNPLPVHFTDSSTGVITNRHWDFGDGSTSNTLSTSVNYTYNLPGTNSVTLTVFGPGGSSTTNLLDYITVTNVVVDITPPQLHVDSPTNNQVFTNADITVTGNASDFNGIASVTINGTAASLVATNWSNSFTLSLGTNTITVIATDSSLQANTATQVVHAIFFVPTNSVPQITSGPTVSNALLQVASVALVAVNSSNTFLVSATDADADPLTYQWVFGDGASTSPSSINTVVHMYTTNECGPYSANISVSDGQDSTVSNFTVVVACAMEISKMQLKPNFAKADMDSWSLTANVVLPGGFTPAEKLVTLDVGGAQVSFTLDSKGRGLNSQGNCKLSFNKKTSTWQLTAKLKKGDWQDTWVDYGLVNADVPKMSATVTLPVALLVGDEGFAADKVLIYTAKGGKSGTAK